MTHRGTGAPSSRAAAERGRSRDGLGLPLILALILGFLAVAFSPPPHSLSNPKDKAATPRAKPVAPPSVAIKVHFVPEPPQSTAPPPASAGSSSAAEGGDAGSGTPGVGPSRVDSVPRLEGRFALPFSQYLEAVEGVGGRLVVFDEAQNRLVGHLAGGVLRSGFDMAGFSLRARDVTADVPAALREPIFKEARSFGAGVPRLLVVLPADVDARFFSDFRQALGRHGIDLAKQDRVTFSYQRRGSTLVAVIEQVEADGRARRLREVVPLGFSTLQ